MTKIINAAALRPRTLTAIFGAENRAKQQEEF
jgi:hypothetical protein